jgi:hypothetical protein
MKKLISKKLFLSMVLLSQLTLLSSQSQESLPFLMDTATQFELVGFPVHHPPLESGKVQSVSGTLVNWSPGFQWTSFGSALPLGQEYYAEVVGPMAHPWLGQRFELDENATRVRSDNGLVSVISPLNTCGMPNHTLVGADLEIRRHLTIDTLWGEAVRNRILFGGEKRSSFRFSFSGGSNGSRIIAPTLDEAKSLRWLDTKSPASMTSSLLVIPPGTAVGIIFGSQRGFPLAISGVAKTWPTAAPLQSGENFLAYPYCADLRLGVDWGSKKEGFTGATKPSSNEDRLEILAGTSRRCYFPESQSNGSVRWRLFDPMDSSGSWANPPSYLERIPVGQGFMLRKAKADPNHLFYPPQS